MRLHHANPIDRSFLSLAAPFLFPFGVTLLGCAVMMLAYDKAQLHLLINAANSPVADGFFAWLTWMGDGWTATVVAIGLLFIRYRSSIVVASGNIAAGLVVQILKRSFFNDWVRPLEYFRSVHALHLVPGLSIYSYHSFPSGHAATAFATCFCLALYTPTRLGRALLFIAAALIAFSRVYLSQHFLGDVVAGAIIGTAVAGASFLVMERLPALKSKETLEGSLLARLHEPRDGVGH